MKTTPFYAYAVNHQARLIVRLSGFSCWEHLQGAFACGLQLAPGLMADAIGRQPWAKVLKYAIVHGYSVKEARRASK